jgi:agmatine deiminase
MISWVFNAWGEKFTDFAKDNDAATEIAKLQQLECIEAPFVLEGGAMEVNGAGLGITTENVVYNNNRNPKNKKATLTKFIKKYFGLDELIVLTDGLINDDTDGHVDNITRFAARDTVLTCTCPEENPNHNVLKSNLEQLQEWYSNDGRKLKIIELPLPDPIYIDQEILPASYANFLITNGAVFIPSFDQKEKDLLAQKILSQCFPNKMIIPIDCRNFLLEGGAIHCLSQQLL